MRQFPSTKKNKKKWTSLVLSLTAGNVRFPIRPRRLFEHSSQPLTQLAIYLFISSLSSIHWEKFNTDMHFNCVLSLNKKFDFMFASIGWQDSFSYNRFIFTIFAYILFTIDYTTPHLHTHTHKRAHPTTHTHATFNSTSCSSNANRFRLHLSHA